MSSWHLWQELLQGKDQRSYWITSEFTHLINKPMFQCLPAEVFQATGFLTENFLSYTKPQTSMSQRPEKGKLTSSWAARGWKGNADTAVGHFCENVWVAACSWSKDTKDVVDLPRAEAARYNTRGSATSATCSCWANNLVKRRTLLIKDHFLKQNCSPGSYQWLKYQPSSPSRQWMKVFWSLGGRHTWVFWILVLHNSKKNVAYKKVTTFSIPPKSSTIRLDDMQSLHKLGNISRSLIIPPN